MKTEEMIRKKLKFLEEEHHFRYQYFFESGNHYIYENDYGTFIYYEWQEFGEKEFTIKTNQEIKTINMLHENPKLMGEFQNKYRGLRGLFKNNKEEYWNIIRDIIKEEIDKNGSLFGIQI